MLPWSRFDGAEWPGSSLGLPEAEPSSRTSGSERVTKLAHCRSDFGGGAKNSGRSSACSFKVRKNRSRTPFASGWCGKRTQNRRRSSRTATDGRPGDINGARPDRSERRLRLFHRNRLPSDVATTISSRLGCPSGSGGNRGGVISD